MSGPLFWEDVTEGTELPPLVKNPTTRQLVQYAGASGDFNEIHYDRSFAQSEGLQDLLLQGALKNAFLGQADRRLDRRVGRFEEAFLSVPRHGLSGTAHDRQGHGDSKVPVQRPAPGGMRHLVGKTLRARRTLAEQLRWLCRRGRIAFLKRWSSQLIGVRKKR